MKHLNEEEEKDFFDELMELLEHYFGDGKVTITINDKDEDK